jgi:Domain of unknown function (DUF4365)
MIRPTVSSTYFEERKGVYRVAELFTLMSLVFRETPNADVGIDGQVELVDGNNQATGATIAVQIKSGTSYLKDGGDSWKYYPSEKHRIYWEAYPLPVILLLHDPQNNLVYWVDARRQLRSDQYNNQFIWVPKASTLTASSKFDLFESSGTANAGLLAPMELLKHLAVTKSGNASFPLSNLDIFLEGLTDIGLKLFFSAGMCWDLAETRLDDDAPTGVGMGGGEQVFLDSYIRFLVEQSIALIDYSDVLIDMRDRDMFPTLLVPLTSRGRAVRDLCRKIGSVGSPYEITEASIGLAYRPLLIFRSQANLAVARKVEEHFLDSNEEK